MRAPHAEHRHQDLREDRERGKRRLEGSHSESLNYFSGLQIIQVLRGDG